MSRGKASGYTLTNTDAAIVLGMVARGDRDHDIACYFGVNQGRIAEVKDGTMFPGTQAATSGLPPKGPPGIKGRRLRDALNGVAAALASGNQKKAADDLSDALADYDANEP
jgi:hypothetical protein